MRLVNRSFTVSKNSYIQKSNKSSGDKFLCTDRRNRECQMTECWYSRQTGNDEFFSPACCCCCWRFEKIGFSLSFGEEQCSCWRFERRLPVNKIFIVVCLSHLESKNLATGSLGRRLNIADVGMDRDIDDVRRT
jgi:hypothetical protein